MYMKIFKPSDLEKMDKAYHSEPDNRYDCMNGMTLPSWHWTCDGDKDCPDGDDESVCNNTEWEYRGKFLRKIRTTFIITARSLPSAKTLIFTSYIFISECCNTLNVEISTAALEFPGNLSIVNGAYKIVESNTFGMGIKELFSNKVQYQHTSNSLITLRFQSSFILEERVNSDYPWRKMSYWDVSFL